eukprot:TRINITY_DN72931_c6_g1_i1.p1 TRINITY_DN72931_c6_g1~~TRINITY_DN72931_c6_g1_i1.p1  ORF type:complete len:119 (-),score=19.83 TRINITY_DN72931_c6_g1_i1:53-382(-)
MSQDLVWQLIKNNSCFLKKEKRIGAVFSTEKFNLIGKSQQKFSGLAAKKAIDVSFNKGKIEMTLKGKKNQSKAVLNKGGKKLESVISKTYFREDLLELAKAKYEACKKM